MKRVDVTKSVMEKVVRFEEQRTWRWVWLFLALVAAIVASIGMSVFSAYRTLHEQRTLDLFELLFEDGEIVAEFWRDVVSVALEELPQTAILAAGIFMCLLIGLFIVTRRQRLIARRRLDELAKRRKTGNNTSKT